MSLNFLPHQERNEHLPKARQIGKTPNREAGLEENQFLFFERMMRHDAHYRAKGRIRQKRWGRSE